MLSIPTAFAEVAPTVTAKNGILPSNVVLNITVSPNATNCGYQYLDTTTGTKSTYITSTGQCGYKQNQPKRRLTIKGLTAGNAYTFTVFQGTSNGTTVIWDKTQLATASITVPYSSPTGILVFYTTLSEYCQW